MKACRAGHLCTVQFLISKRADVNRQTTNNDHTPLSLACAGGHLAVVELLLAQSANPFHKLKVSENTSLLLLLLIYMLKARISFKAFRFCFVGCCFSDVKYLSHSYIVSESSYF